MTRRISLLTFIILAVVAAALAVISASGFSEWYTSRWMMALWGLLGVLAVITCIKFKLWRKPVVALLHLSFLLILTGAFLTHSTGATDTVSLRCGEELDGLTLETFEVETYPGSNTPCNFIAVVNGERISLNSPGHIGSRTLVLNSCDSDLQGATFICSSDPIGLPITYAGYLLLGLSFIGYFFTPNSAWRRAVRALSMAVIILSSLQAGAVNISSQFRERFSETAVFHNDRVTSVSVMAQDFKSSIGASDNPEELFAGLLFDFSTWRKKAIIKVKNKELRTILGVNGKRASYDDFYEAVVSGRLSLESPEDRHKFGPDIDKFQAVTMLVGGSLLKFFPLDVGGRVVWYSPTDPSLSGCESDKWIFIRKFLGLLNEKIVANDIEGQTELLEILARYQIAETRGQIPSQNQMALERIYVKVSSLWWPGPILILLAIFSFILKRVKGISILISTFLSAMFVVRWIITGHIPLANGYETMMFMALCLAVTAIIVNRIQILASMSLLGAGLAMCVATMSGRGASIAGIMPILNSPLLSIHVCLVMVSYALFFIMAITGAYGLIKKSEAQKMSLLNRVFLYPALGLLSSGIFVGAIWANISWGRYWGWDPKEVWALITLIIYSFAAHPSIIKKPDKPRHFLIFSIAAFLSVMMTYFGVNYILGGLHSYA